MEAKGALSHFEHCFQKHLSNQVANAYLWSNRQELQRKRSWKVVSDSALNCSVASQGPSPGLVSNYGKGVGLRASEGLFQFLFSKINSYYLYVSLCLSLFCFLSFYSLSLSYYLSSALSAECPGAYCKSITDFVIDIAYCIQPYMCACFTGLPWGGTGLFQQGRIIIFSVFLFSYGP